MLKPILWKIQGPSESGGSRKFGLPAIFVGRRPLPHPSWAIAGTTKDGVGAVLGGCSVKLFRTEDDLRMDITTSDASTGVYTVTDVGPAEAYWIYSRKDGTPNVTVGSDNDLTGTPSG